MPESPAVPVGPAIPLPLDGPRQSVTAWRDRVTAAKDKREKIAGDAGWKDRIDAYLGKPLKGTPKADTVVVPKDYANVEQKKAQLFTQIPDLHLEPKRDEFGPAAPIAQAVLRDYLGPHHIHADAVMDEVVFDLLCPAGLMCSKIGYASVQDGVQMVEGPPGPPDPLTGQPTPGLPVEVPKTIWERYYWDRVSPNKALVPAEFHGSDYDRADWLGFEFERDAPDGQPGTSDGDASGLNAGESITATRSGTTKQKGVELWYRASVFDPAEKHPGKFRYLVLIDGQDLPERHEDSPYQRVLEDGMILGMRRNPIRIGALRYVSDSAYPPSDCAMSASQADELNKGRTQMVQERDRNIPINWYDRNRVNQDDIDKITKGEIQAFVGVDGNGTELFGDIRKASLSREAVEFDRIINRDMSECWALSVTPGSEVDGPKTATEASLFQGRTDVRLRKERGKVLEYFVAAAEDILALIQLFADDTDYVRIVGADGVGKLRAWDKQAIAGEFAFSAKPDSAVFQDQAVQRKRATETFQFLAPSPFINQQELAAWFLRQNDMEPAKFIAPPKEPEPEKPRVSFSFKGEDLNPLSPQAPIVASIMIQAGFTIPPEAVETSKQIAGLAVLNAGDPDAPHSGLTPTEPRQAGVAAKQGPLNKHESDKTGMTNAGLSPAVN